MNRTICYTCLTTFFITSFLTLQSIHFTSQSSNVLRQKNNDFDRDNFFVYLAVSNCLYTQTFRPFHSWKQGYNWPRSQEAAAIFVDRNENSWQRHLCLHRIHGGGGAGVNSTIKSLRSPQSSLPSFYSHWCRQSSDYYLELTHNIQFLSLLGYHCRC